MIGCRPTWHEQDTMQGCKSARSVLQSRDCHLQQVLGPNLSSQHMGSHVNDDQPIPRLLNMPPCMFTHAQISQHLWTPCGIDHQPVPSLLNVPPHMPGSVRMWDPHVANNHEPVPKLLKKPSYISTEACTTVTAIFCNF